MEPHQAQHHWISQGHGHMHPLAVPVSQSSPNAVAHEPEQWRLNVMQCPDRARVSTVKEKDRKNVDPPPILKLAVGDSVSALFLHSPFLYVVAYLQDAPGELGANNSKTIPTENALCGSMVSSLHKAKLNDDTDHALFVFADMAVKKEGWFQLRFELHSIDTVNCEDTFLCETSSNPFEVYAPRRFPGFYESTFLTRLLSDQGIRIRVRKDSSQYKTRKHNASLGDQNRRIRDPRNEQDEMYAQGGHISGGKAPQSKRRRPPSTSVDTGFSTQGPAGRYSHSPSSAGPMPFATAYGTHALPMPGGMSMPPPRQTLSASQPIAFNMHHQGSLENVYNFHGNQNLDLNSDRAVPNYIHTASHPPSSENTPALSNASDPNHSHHTSLTAVSPGTPVEGSQFPLLPANANDPAPPYGSGPPPTSAEHSFAPSYATQHIPAFSASYDYGQTSEHGLRSYHFPLYEALPEQLGGKPDDRS